QRLHASPELTKQLRVGGFLGGGRRMLAITTVITGIRAVAIPGGCIVVIITSAAGIRQSIQDEPGGPTTGGGEQSNRPVDNVAWGLLRLQDYANRLNEGSHQQRVAHGEDRRAIDHHAVV